jgi:hypothetical protein
LASVVIAVAATLSTGTVLAGPWNLSYQRRTPGAGTHQRELTPATVDRASAKRDDKQTSEPAVLITTVLDDELDQLKQERDKLRAITERAAAVPDSGWESARGQRELLRQQLHDLMNKLPRQPKVPAIRPGAEHTFAEGSPAA